VNAWLAVLAAGIGSYAFRLGAVVVIDRFELPDWFDRVSAHVMPAVFAGLAAASLAVPMSDGGRTAMPVFAGAIVTVAVARKRSAATAVFAGMVVLCTVQLAGAALGS
jgi:branched-subunit amino acid transport protein